MDLRVVLFNLPANCLLHRAENRVLRGLWVIKQRAQLTRLHAVEIHLASTTLLADSGP